MSEVHVVFHLVTDPLLSISDIAARHPVMVGLRNCLHAASHHDIHTITIPLLMVHKMSPVSSSVCVHVCVCVCVCVCARTRVRVCVTPHAQSTMSFCSNEIGRNRFTYCTVCSLACQAVEMITWILVITFKCLN